MVLNELYNKIIDLDLSEYTHQKLYDLCFELDDEIERLNNIINTIQQEMENLNDTRIFSIKPKYVWQRIETLKGVNEK